VTDDSGDFTSIKTVHARDGGPHFTKEEWARRLQTHIYPPLGSPSIETQLRQKIVELEAKIAELERKKPRRRAHDELLGGLDQIEGLSK